MLVAQSYLTLCVPMDCSPPGTSVHGILQARILEWVAIPFSRELPNPGIEPRSPSLQAGSLPSESPGKLKNTPKKMLTKKKQPLRKLGSLMFSLQIILFSFFSNLWNLWKFHINWDVLTELRNCVLTFFSCEWSLHIHLFLGQTHQWFKILISLTEHANSNLRLSWVYNPQRCQWKFGKF